MQQIREDIYNKTLIIQEKIKKIHEKGTKADDFQLDDLLLRWVSRNEEKGKHGKFDCLWKGPFKIEFFEGNNALFLEDLTGEGLLVLTGEELPGWPVNGRIIKHYFIQE